MNRRIKVSPVHSTHPYLWPFFFKAPRIIAHIFNGKSENINYKSAANGFCKFFNEIELNELFSCLQMVYYLSKFVVSFRSKLARFNQNLN